MEILSSLIADRSIDLALAEAAKKAQKQSGVSREKLLLEMFGKSQDHEAEATDVQVQDK